MILDILQKIYAHQKIVDGTTEWQLACRENDKRLNWHRAEEYPEELLGGFRPSEEPWQKEYRRLVFRAVGSKTKPQIGSVETALGKIQQSDDFKIYYETDFKETGILKENSLEEYLEGKLPLYKSLETWLFGPAKSELVWGPNGFVVMMPELEYFKKNPGQLSLYDQKETPKPYPRIYPAKHVVWVDPIIGMFWTGEYTDEQKNNVDTYVAITKDQVAMIERRIGKATKNNAAGYEWTQEVFDYPCGILPVFPVGHLIDRIREEKKVYNSVISNGLPNLNEALRTNDDLTVFRTFHIHPKYWEINAEICKTCQGNGYVLNTKNERANCTACRGGGYAVESPFNKLAISYKKLQEANEDGNAPNMPYPWAGYIERPIELFKTYKDDFKDECYQFFASNNIEFLNEVPLNESGKAKEVDKEEVHTFFYPNALQLKYLYQSCATAAYFQLYRPAIENNLVDSEKLEKALPHVTVPTEFNVLTSQALADQLAQRIKDGMDPYLIEGGTVDLMKKQFGENSPIIEKYKVKKEIDPLPFLNAEQKSIAYMDRSITQYAYVLSTNIDYFIENCIQENPKFFELTRAEQKAMLKAQTDAEIKAINSNLVNIPDAGVGA